MRELRVRDQYAAAAPIIAHMGPTVRWEEGQMGRGTDEKRDRWKDSSKEGQLGRGMVGKRDGCEEGQLRRGTVEKRLQAVLLAS